MVSLSPEFLKFKRARKEVEEIERSIASNINSIKETSIQTRQLMVDCREAMRRLDQFKWH